MTDLDPTTSPFANRLRKNARAKERWAKRSGLTAYRVYDRDMPEYPFAVDWYAGRVNLIEYPRRSTLRKGALEPLRREVLAAVHHVLEVPPERVFVKTHLPHVWGKSQYGAQPPASEPFIVEEQGLRFWVELSAHLDSGLFLDHRLTCARVRDEARGRRVLNLFAYTGSFSVYAAAGGARSTLSVDLSNTYCAWAEKNLALNGFSGPEHRVVRADVLRWLESARERFELIVLDPPSFSASKKMTGAFNVQRDHPRLIEATRALLAPGGTLYFSTNYQGFSLHPSLKGEEITAQTTPEDFRHTPHRCWRFT